MRGFVSMMSDGSWLTRERMRLVALAMLVASVAGVTYLLATSDGLNDYRGRPLGTDFSNLYAAGTYVLEGRPEAPFDPPLQHFREQTLFGAKTPFYGWHYPPFFLFVAAALALMPYGVALLVWQGATLALYLAAMRAVLSVIPPPQGRGIAYEYRRRKVFSSASNAKRATIALIPASADREKEDSASNSKCDCPAPQGEGGSAAGRTGWGAATQEHTPPDCSLHSQPPSPFRGGIRDRLWLLLALAFPAVFVNLGHGHNGFLTAALLAGALVLLDARPAIAGILFGLLAYKPQFGLMIPLVLLASGRWRTFIAAAATVGLLAIVTTLAFGPDIWRAFLASTAFTREVVLEAGDTGWHKIQSAFSWVRMWGGSVPLAYALQGPVSLAVGAALVWLWRSDAAYPLKAAALCLAAIIATPYSLDYDMMVLAPALAFLAAHGLAHGFAPYEKTALAVLWLTPLIARSMAEMALIPLGVIVMLAVFVLVIGKAMRLSMDSDAVPGHPRAPATPRESTR